MQRLESPAVRLAAAALALALFNVVVAGGPYDPGFWVILALTSYAALRVANLRGRWFPSRLFLAAATLVVLGSLARYEVLFQIYAGGGDATRYYEVGLARAQELRSLELTPLSPAYWDLRTSRWGTGFVEQVSGLVLVLTGATLRGEFIVFALFGLTGTYLVAKSYRLTNGLDRSLVCASVIWLWPSVWFWPSSVGKESLVLLSFGLTTYGFVGDGRAHRWGYLVAGLALSFMVRPHVTSVLVLAVVGATVLAPTEGRLTNRRVAQLVATSILAVVVLQGAVSRLGLQDADLEGIQEFAAAAQAGSSTGGSNVGSPSGPLAPVQAVINTWSRPFPWEVNSLTSAAAAVEIVLLWGLIWYQRRALRSTVRHWRHHRMLRFAFLLLVGYTLMIGLTFGNLGIIARQRAPVFPFLLLLLLGAEAPGRVTARCGPKRYGTGLKAIGGASSAAS